MTTVFVAVVLLAVAVTVGVVSWTCERVGWPTPLVLVVVGAVVAAVPGVPHVELQPDIVLIGVLPPLLYAAAVRTSLVDFRANRMSTLVLSVGAVAFGTVAVGLFTWWVVPGAMTLAAGLALGAVVAPPDAVATTAIGRRTPPPPRPRPPPARSGRVRSPGGSGWRRRGASASACSPLRCWARPGGG